MKLNRNWVWGHTPVIPMLMRLRQEECLEFEVSLSYISEFWASLGYSMRPYLM